MRFDSKKKFIIAALGAACALVSSCWIYLKISQDTIHLLKVSDEPLHCDLEIKDTRQIQRAYESFKRLTASLKTADDEYVKNISRLSNSIDSFVFFMRHEGHDQDFLIEAKYSIMWLPVGATSGLTFSSDGVFECGIHEWYGFFGELISSKYDEYLAEFNEASGDSQRRMGAALKLSIIRPSTDGLLEYFIQRIDSSEDALDSLWGIGAMGPLAKGAVPKLIDKMDDYNQSYNVLVALQRIGPDASSATARLIDFLGDNSKKQGWYLIAETLASFGSASATAIPALKKAAEEDPDSKELILNAIRKINDR